MATTRLSNSVTCSIDITQLGRAFEDSMTQLQQTIANSVLREVVTRTPIDTGRAKSNWQVGVGQVQTSAIPSYAPGKGGSTYNEVNTTAIAQGQAIIRMARWSDVVNITNNLEYIRKLNDGTSTQAPAGFVEAAVVIAIRQIPNIRITP